MQTYNITIVGFDHALASVVTGAMDLFSLAGVTWNYIHQQPASAPFNVSIASVHGRPVNCINHIQLLPHIDIANIEHSDLILIPTIGGDVVNNVKQSSNLASEINRLINGGSKIASNCTGAFLLAELGLLNGRLATTHWGFESLFRRHYPKVKLDTSQLVTHEEGIYCAGGGVAWLDLVLLLIADFCGEDIAEETAKAHVLDLSRTSQRAYTSIQQKTLHGDKEIAAIQKKMMQDFAQAISIESIAIDAGMTQRTLIRRFKQACDQTPLQYLQSVRIGHARKLLETTNLSVESIVYNVGYADASTFVQLFKRWIGMSPNQYRSRHKLN